MATSAPATIDDLYRVDGKAELVGGRIVKMSPASEDHGIAAGEIFYRLRQHQERTSQGRAYPDGTGFLCDLPHRQSFCPDAAWYTGPRSGEEFLPTAPVFAAEVRSKDDYGRAAEQRLAEKRDDYFAAGTLVVWDVDLRSEDVIRAYFASDPNRPVAFRCGDTVHAEPAVPGWTFPVNALFG